MMVKTVSRVAKLWHVKLCAVFLQRPLVGNVTPLFVLTFRRSRNLMMEMLLHTSPSCFPYAPSLPCPACRYISLLQIQLEISGALWASPAVWSGKETPELPCKKIKIAITRMWANAQRDGRPAEHRWRPLFNAAKFGRRPILDAVQ